MNERDLFIQQLINEKGGTKEQYLHLLNVIANHETGGTYSSTQKQLDGGPGRGKYQFEVGKHKGGITAAKRLKVNYIRNKKPIPYWLRKATKGDDLDVSDLTSEQQDILFLANMREHPRADFSKVWNEEQSITDFWADNHWAGKKRDRKTRVAKFNEDYKNFSENKPYPVLEGPKNEGISDERRFPTETPSFTNNFQTKFTYGGGIQGFKDHVNKNELNSFNTGGTHQQNPLGGIPQGMGQNGNQNTVEQGETSFKLKNGKYIFSNRIKL